MQAQPPLQQSRIVLRQTAPTPEEVPLEPLELQEIQSIPPHSSRPPPISPRTPTQTTQISPSQVPDVSAGGLQLVLYETTGPPSSSRQGSGTPIPRTPRGTTPFHTPNLPPADLQAGGGELSQHDEQQGAEPYWNQEMNLDESGGRGGGDGPISPTASPPRETQSEQNRTPRHGKQRRTEPFSDEETTHGGGAGTASPPRVSQSERTRTPWHGRQRGTEPFSDEETTRGGGAGGDGDISMDDGPNFGPYERQHGGVCSISF